MKVLAFLLILINLLCVVEAFRLVQRSMRLKWRAVRSTPESSTVVVDSSSWQQELDKFLDIDTTFESRKDITSNLFKRLDEISKDVSEAIKDRNIEKLAPPSLTYGKNLKSAKAFRRQLTQDIIPDLVTQQIPRIVSAAPSIAKKLLEKGPSAITKQGNELFTKAKDISQDPSALQATVDDARNEFRNIFKSTPAGLYSPPFEVIKSTDNYEIRKYSGFSVASTGPSSTNEASSTGSSSDSSTSPAGSSLSSDVMCAMSGFSELASYLFGENSNSDGRSEPLSMTTPVIMADGAMKFVLPGTLTAASAPTPLSGKIALEDVPEMVVAVRGFSGLATDKETARQRALLEDALLADGLVYDNLSFQTFQYNPPQTLPWLRRNEAVLKIFLPASESSSAMAMDGEAVAASIASADTAAGPGPVAEEAVPEIIYESTPPEAGD